MIEDVSREREQDLDTPACRSVYWDVLLSRSTVVEDVLRARGNALQLLRVAQSTESLRVCDMLSLTTCVGKREIRY